MQHKKIIIANWKMKLQRQETVALAQKIMTIERPDAEVVICPSAVYLKEVHDMTQETEIRLGAQNIFWEKAGAFTGEISGAQVKELGCQYVIIGHSERRTNLHETDQMIHEKIDAALQNDLIPIVCIGESFDERTNGSHDYVLIYQLTKALEGIKLHPHQQIIIAYEPVWTIGTGQAIKPTDAQAAHEVIKRSLADLYVPGVIEQQFRIVYGGSVDSNNVASFTRLPHTDGVLVGSASLHADEFKKIVANA